MKFPVQGRQKQELLQQLSATKQFDVPWSEGKVFAYVYDAGEEAMDLLEQAFTMYMTENGLDPTSFPSCMQLEKEVIGMAMDLVNASENGSGTFTSGGTESILLSLKTARDRARDLQPHITQPEIVLPVTAHAAFFKACQYFDLIPVTVEVDDNFRAIPEKMDAAITDNTILMVGSAPSYGHGAIDPIEDLGQIALKHNILFHVDCCVGGMYLPFAKSLGYDIPNFDMGVPGVTQLSMDFHKWGYAAKGASCILYNDADVRRYQIFSHANWTGYAVINPGVTSTKSGGPVAACWAILNYMGREGYERLVDASQAATIKLLKAVEGIDGLAVMGDPKANLIALKATDFNIFPLADEMKTRGWYIQPQFSFENSQENLHLSIGYHNVEQMDAFIADLTEMVAALRSAQHAEAKQQALDPQIKAMLENATPQDLGKISAMLGIDPSNPPERMEDINALLNGISADSREVLLGEFINQIYMPA
ncbi:pyridoxal phosphate-dependent decarboxylase family protein [Paraferrimonas sedimenticola]|uniref:Aspartate aminotransferase family protein n=1 Tax=Paraferrimonas sedimenticola TaxID=375674 RepID=A0AA37RXZ1_9GAMM|nr:aspartate aminotransferase family protein [Paraferrimonas sedimenticola]GLP97790.1 aspartate aminotransferase family protein [Paraferrimonas sedimenticola]